MMQVSKTLKDLETYGAASLIAKKLEINNNNNILRKISNIWKLNYTYLNNACFKKEITNNL